INIKRDMNDSFPPSIRSGGRIIFSESIQEELSLHKNNLLSLKTDALLHSADYNPDQWLHAPDILEKDIELMGKARCNVMSVGIFSWSKLEPEEGVFDFEWLVKILDS